MKIEKYNIRVGRDIVKVNKDGKLSNTSFPKDIASDNMFIQKQDKKYLIKIESPFEKSIQDVYEKFEEIFNVIAEELYNAGDVIWIDSSYDEKVEANAYVSFSFDEEFLEEENKNAKEIYSRINSIFTSNREVIEKMIGKYKCKATGKRFDITICLDADSRLGVSDETLKLICTLCFISLESFDIIDKALLKRIDKKYHLKAAEAIENIFSSSSKNACKKEKNDALMKRAKQYMEESHNLRYAVRNHNRLVAASRVVLKDSIAQGVDYRILNESKNIVEHFKGNHREYIIEGNKTDRDNYIFPIITDDKYIAKQVMKAAGLCVPEAIILYKSMDETDIEERVKPYYNSKLVVKPRNTNYGTGITVFSKNADKKQIMNAIKYAFEFDDNILIEEYVKGMEYRFLVVDGKCVSIAHRRAASVVGDGKSTIQELMKEKGKESWHVLTGSPIKFEPPVEEYLKEQGLTYDSIVPKGKRVFVRKNSNCSSGGETIDYTDVIPARFKRIAEKATKAFDGKICGVDIIIDDLKSDKYAIIEINDNPGYSINEWPYEGKGEKVGVSILKLLGF